MTAPLDSLSEEVMADPDARHAYFHITKGVLSGRADDPSTQQVKAQLDAAGIAYLYNPDWCRPRPLFLAPHRVFVGAKEIEEYIAALQKQRLV